LAEEAETSAVTTQKKNRLLLNRLKKFSELRGYLSIERWEPMDVREFRSSWGLARRAHPPT
jgi:hypothetical protein